MRNISFSQTIAIPNKVTPYATNKQNIKILYVLINQLHIGCEIDVFTYFWVTALRYKSEIFVTNFLHFEQASSSSNIFFANFIGSGAHGATTRASDAIVIRFADTSNSCYIRFRKEILSKI